VVPYRGSRLFQRTSITADPNATVILGETLLPGRVAHGEAHVYDLFWAETEVSRPDGTLLFSDVLRFSPMDGESPKSAGLLGTYDVVATLYVITRQVDPLAMVALLRSALATCPDVAAGLSELPNGCGTAVRVLGPTSKAVQYASIAAWNAARLEVLRVPAPNLRKG
jgi:urease accessory protein